MKFKIVCTLLGVLCWITSTNADAPPRWDREEAQKYGWIYDDFEAGVDKAVQTGKPMLVVLRCPP